MARMYVDDHRLGMFRNWGWSGPNVEYGMKCMQAFGDFFLFLYYDLHVYMQRSESTD